MARLQNTEAKILDSHFLGGRREGDPMTATMPQQAPTPDNADWDLNRKLQTSLDINDIATIFFEGIQAEFHCAQMVYENKPSNTQITLGNTSARHSCNYQIEIAGDSLGRLSFTRSIRFAEVELNRLEELLCLLVYPLRNALLYKEAIEQAMHDPLTGALNRSALSTMIKKEIDLSHRHQQPLSVLMIDIDHFKQINDTYGHAMGDKVLCTLVDQLNKIVRNSDILFRYGGEEFTILLNNTNTQGANLLAQRIRRGIESMTQTYDESELQLTVSIGMATLCEDEVASELLERADQALYSAKKFGRNCVIQA